MPPAVKKVGVIALRVLIVYLAVEVFSFLGFLAVTRQVFSFERASRDRQRQIDAASASAPAGRPAGSATTPITPHPFLGFTYDPNFNPAGVLRNHGVPVSDWGFLDDKPPIQPKSKDKVIVGIFGGSVAMWFSLHGLPTLFEELRKAPELKGKELVVVRTALGGFKQPQQLQTLSYLLALGAHFDVLINLDGFNEVALAAGSNVQQGTFAFYPRDWPGLLGAVGDPAMVRLVGEVSYLEARRGRTAAFFSRPVVRHSVFAGLIWRILDRRLGNEIGGIQVALAQFHPMEGTVARQYAARGPARHYANDQEMYRDLVDVWRRSSLEMDRLAAANGIRYFHFLQPNQYFAGSKPIGAEEAKIAFDPLTTYRTGVRVGYPLLRAAGRELIADGVPFEDLSMIFAGIEKPLYIDNCCHYSVEGNSILARRIAAAIRRSLASGPV